MDKNDALAVKLGLAVIFLATAAAHAAPECGKEASLSAMDAIDNDDDARQALALMRSGCELRNYYNGLDPLGEAVRVTSPKAFKDVYEYYSYADPEKLTELLDSKRHYGYAGNVFAHMIANPHDDDGHGSAEILKYVYEHGYQEQLWSADPKLPAVEFAAQTAESVEVMEFFLRVLSERGGAKPEDYRSSFKDATLVHLAAVNRPRKEGQPASVLVYLVESAHIDPATRDSSGHSPQDWAQTREIFKENADYLRSRSSL